ncbi:hypothetical protein NDN01_25605 [Sphingomonas sp. QA11]|uniref:hypothetical protein n=1 Tax=Sphingomonas sp. QA11 TaxID=2950605 RepID=UPI00234A521D|nr:hypothetical protein [Sphingomonas sp. QA11]WCM27316.1 hypothetical protein NDN01_25605 [Sphingomonas sp. QA11]
MAIPNDLTKLCEQNAFCWHRNSPKYIDEAFDQFGWERSGELYEFLLIYALQFNAIKFGYELLDIVDEDGRISDNIEFFYEELGIERDFIPLSSFEAGGAYVYRIRDGKVFEIKSNADLGQFEYEEIAGSFFNFMRIYLS